MMRPWRGTGRCATVAAVVRRWFAWRLIAALCVVTVPGAPVVAQEASGRTERAPDAAPEEAPEAAAVPAPLPPEQRRDYWPLLVAGIGVTAGGLVGARLARLETERWMAMPPGTANRQPQIDAFETWTVAGSVAASVGVGLIVLWATIRLSQDARLPGGSGA